METAQNASPPDDNGCRCVKRQMSDIRSTILSDTTCIDIDVGLPAQRFVVTKSLICEHSPFFKNALKENWKESAEHILTLPTDSPGAFVVYRTWLYLNKIELPDNGDVSRSLRNKHSSRFTKEDINGVVAAQNAFAHAYVLGDKLQDSGFKNAVLDELIECIQRSKMFPSMLAAYIYANTVDRARLRRLVVEFWAHFYNRGFSVGNSVEQAGDMVHGPREFLVDVLKRLGEMRSRVDNSGRPLWISNRCMFHEHAGS